MGILEDLYSTENCCETEKEVVTYEEILLQNHSKCKITERLELPELRDDILQICHSNGDVRVESTQLTEAGILVEGVLSVSFLYVKTDDKVPFGIWEGLVPFQHLITTGELSSNACYNLVSSLEQISVTLMGGDNVEVKAMPTFRSLIRQKKEAINITGIVVKPYEEKGDEKQPGIIGYLVKDEDDLWEIAKKYRTTKTSICEANGITEESIKTGQRILILKENVGIL